MRAHERLRIERRKTLIEHERVGPGEERARQEHAAPFALRQPPTGVAHLLIETGRHAREYVVQAQLFADRLRLRQLLLGRRPGTAPQQVARKRAGAEMILVGLPRERRSSSKPIVAE